MTRRAYPLAEVAQMLGVSERTVRREIKDGRITARRIRRALVVVASEIDRYLATAPEESGATTVLSLRTVKPSPSTGRGRVQRLVSPIARES